MQFYECRNGFFMQLKGMMLKEKTQRGMISVCQPRTCWKCPQGAPRQSVDKDLPLKEFNLWVKYLKIEWFTPTFSPSISSFNFSPERQNQVCHSSGQEYSSKDRSWPGCSPVEVALMAHDISWVPTGCGSSLYLLSASCVSGKAFGAWEQQQVTQAQPQPHEACGCFKKQMCWVRREAGLQQLTQD